MKAIILAAGQGTRLRPVTLTMPKPLVPVANKPLIEYAIGILRQANIREIGIVVNSLDSPICHRLGDGSNLSVQIDYIVQREQLGLAHAIGLCEAFVGDESFCVFLGDNIFQDQMKPLLQGFETSDTEAVVGLREVSDPRRFGIAELSDGYISRVVEKPQHPTSNLAIAGVYLFRNTIFNSIGRIQPSWRNEYEITDAIQDLIECGGSVKPYILEGWWIDAGKPDAIIRANQLVLSEMPYDSTSVDDGTIDGESEVTSRVIIGKRSCIVDSVVRGPVIIGNDVVVKSSYIGPYSSIGDHVEIENSEIEASIVMENCVICDIEGRIDSSLLADNTHISSSLHQMPTTHRFTLAENSYVQI